MPLRDHFRPPLSKQLGWESVHAMWPGEMVRVLFPNLPPGYRAAPKVHLGTAFELDVAASDTNGGWWPTADAGGGGVATAVRAAVEPSLAVDIDSPDPDEFAVEVYDDERGRLVAAVELVSPANKDRHKTRQLFVDKCAALLARGVCVAVVDLVTTRPANLHAELLERVDRTDPAVDANRSHLYAVTHRWQRSPKRRTRAESWYHPLALGDRLPELPLWLADDLSVTLDLETSYEETCKYLHVT